MADNKQTLSIHMRHTSLSLSFITISITINTRVCHSLGEHIQYSYRSTSSYNAIAQHHHLFSAQFSFFSFLCFRYENCVCIGQKAQRHRSVRLPFYLHYFFDRDASVWFNLHCLTYLVIQWTRECDNDLRFCVSSWKVYKILQPNMCPIHWILMKVSKCLFLSFYSNHMNKKHIGGK